MDGGAPRVCFRRILLRRILLLRIGLRRGAGRLIDIGAPGWPVLRRARTAAAAAARSARRLPLPEGSHPAIDPAVGNRFVDVASAAPSPSAETFNGKSAPHMPGLRSRHFDDAGLP